MKKIYFFIVACLLSLPLLTVAQDLDPAGIARARNTYGGTGHDAVRVQLGEAKARLQSDEAMVEGM